MSARTFAFVGFKLIGFWFMVQAAGSLAGVPSLVRPSSGTMAGQLVSLFLLPIVATGVVGAATWAGANWLAARVSEGADDEGESGSASAVASPLVLALSVLGAWLTAWAIPELVNGLALFVISRGGPRSVLGSIDYSQQEQVLVWSTSAKAAVFGAAARAAVGLLLVNIGEGGGSCPYIQLQADNEIRRTIGHEMGHAVGLCHRGQCLPEVDDTGVAASVMSSGFYQGPLGTAPTANYDAFDRAQIRLHGRGPS